jgi:Zn ribbon nucleic-acid-binding protein
LNKIDELNKDFNDTISDINIVKCGKQVRKEIKELKDTIPWPPQPHDLIPENIHIPYSLELLMDTIMDSRPSRLKVSISQDIIYNVSGGRIKTPKSVLLPSIVKTLTNNTELIRILNRLGHGLSYSLLMEAQTENAYQILEKQFKSGCIIPADSAKESFTIFVADNIDRQEETLSGNFFCFI